MFFALAMHRERHSSDGNDEWQTRNIRLGGYKYLHTAMKALKGRSANGVILNDQRVVVASLQSNTVRMMEMGNA
jgi:hypothetical protein